MIAYLDTSALVKLFMPDEEGAGTTEAIWDASDAEDEALVMLTWDERLAAAARRAELEVVP